MIHASSRESLATVRRHLDGAINGMSPDNLYSLAEELYGVGNVLAGQPRLRRMLGDPAVEASARVELAERVFSGKVSEEALGVVREAVAQRWSTPWNMADSFEIAGDDVLLAIAERTSELDSVEDDLFRFARILAVESRLSTLLDDSSAEAAPRVELVRNLLGNKVSRVTLRLVEHAVASTRKSSVELAIDQLLVRAAERQNRTTAQVTSAAPLTPDQEVRLATVLSQMYGRQIHLRVAINPDVRGGLVIRVGDEIIDGSVAARLEQARSALSR